MIKVRRCSIAEFYSIYNLVWPDQAEDPQYAEEEAETLDPAHRARHWLALVGTEPAGVLEVGHDLGSFHIERWQLDLSVLPDFRKRGVASALADKADRFLDGLPATLFSTRVKDDTDSIRFAEKRGYAEMKRDFWSVLDLNQVDLEGINAMLQRLPAEIELRSFNEVDSPEIRSALHDLFEDVRVDIPRVSPPTPLSFQQFERLVLSDPSLDHDCTTLACRGNRFVGSSTAFTSIKPGTLDQGLTGVQRDERGQGLAQAIKADVILKAKNKGYQHVRTDNDSRNLPILSINDRLGFQRLPATITMTRKP